MVHGYMPIISAASESESSQLELATIADYLGINARTCLGSNPTIYTKPTLSVNPYLGQDVLFYWLGADSTSVYNIMVTCDSLQAKTKTDKTALTCTLKINT